MKIFFIYFITSLFCLFVYIEINASQPNKYPRTIKEFTFETIPLDLYKYIALHTLQSASDELFPQQLHTFCFINKKFYSCYKDVINYVSIVQRLANVTNFCTDTVAESLNADNYLKSNRLLIDWMENPTKDTLKEILKNNNHSYFDLTYTYECDSLDSGKEEFACLLLKFLKEDTIKLDCLKKITKRALNNGISYQQLAKGNIYSTILAEIFSLGQPEALNKRIDISKIEYCVNNIFRQHKAPVPF